jgi:protocatechuate 3,4-dioxygenase beta subunit
MKLLNILVFLSVLSLAIVMTTPGFCTPLVCQVVDSSGNPVAGATVYISNGNGDATVTILTTDSSGSFTADTVSPGFPTISSNVRFYLIDAKGFGIIGGLLTAANKRIVVDPPITIAGSVVDTGGKPVAGAIVKVLNAIGPNSNDGLPDKYTMLGLDVLKSRFTATTDLKGQYGIAGLPANLMINVQLDDPKYQFQYAQTTAGGTTVPAIVAKPGTVITGKVVREDGKPVGIVDVQANGISTNGNYLQGSEAQTSSDGSFKITGLAPGSFALIVSPANDNASNIDWAPPVSITVKTSLAAPAVSPNLVLTQGGTATGLIEDADTKLPIANVGVTASDTVGYPSARSLQGATDTTGRYTLHVWAGNVNLNVVGVPQDYALDQTTPPDVVTVTDGQTANVDPIYIKRGSTATGKVVGDDGKPIGGLQIQTQRVVNNYSFYSTPGFTQTAPDGTYKLTGLLAGQYSVTASLPTDGSAPYAPPMPVTFTVTPGQPALVPDLVISKGITITGSAEDSVTKAPLPGVLVGIQDTVTNGQGGQMRSVNATTDQNGKFTVTGWAGKLELYVYNVPTAYAYDQAATQRTFQVTAGDPVTLGPILIGHAITVSGVAVDENGQPLPNLTIQAQKSQTGGFWMNIAPATTDKDGSFSVAQLVPGSYSLDAGIGWTVVSPVSFTAPSNAPIKLILKKSLMTTLQGTAVDTSGAPLPGVTLTFQTLHALTNGSETANQVTVTTDNNGYFTLPDVPADRNMVQQQGIVKEGYILKSGGDVSLAGNRLAISLIVMAKLGGQITGDVHNGLDAPVASAWVACPNGSSDVRPVQTDTAGHFQFTNIIEGPVDIYAAKGLYFGQMAVHATKDAGPAVTVALSPNPVQPVAVDLPGATLTLSKMYANAQTSTTGDAWRYRDECAYVLETVSPTAGVNFLQANTKINSGDINYIVSAQAKQNPVATAGWVLPMLQSVQDNGYAGNLAAAVGLDVAPYNIGSATALYNIAAAKFTIDNLNQNTINDAMNLVALAYAVHSPAADGDYAKVMAEIRRENAANNVNVNDPTTSDWLTSSFAQTLARGNLDVALKLTQTFSPVNKPNALQQIVSALVQTHPDEALAVFHMMDNSDPNNSWYYNQALVNVIPLIFKTDPAEALAKAKSITDSQNQSLALTLIADLLPIAQAKPIYEEAESTSVDQLGQGTTPASIAAHAYLRDVTFGAQLFKEAFAKVMTPTPSDQAWQGASYSEFAFYYSRYDPGYSRLLIENQFSKDLASTATNYNSGVGVASDIAAMAAIDPTRATEMVASVKDFDSSFAAELKVAQYVTLSEPVRNTLPFNSWLSNNFWTPDTLDQW